MTRESAHGQARVLALAVFFQMLPATLVAPAIRPLFAAQHDGREAAMHAFMALNMLGGLLAAPWIGTLADRRYSVTGLFRTLAFLDAILLVTLSLPLPTLAVLVLRVVEGAAHVGAATLLLSEAAALARRSGDGKAVGMAGGAIMTAVALGHALGGAAVGLDFRAPFWLGAVLSVGVALAGGRLVCATRRHRAAEGAVAPLLRPLAVPLAAAFLERFTVGCIVVTFALFAHRSHGLTDSEVGYLYALWTLPFALLTYPASRLGDRVPRALLLGLGGLGYSASLMAMGTVSTSALPFVMAGAGVTSALIFAPTLCYAATLAGTQARSRAMGLVNAAGCLGMLVGPAVAGIVAASFRQSGDPAAGYRAVFVMAATSVAVGLVAGTPWLARRLREERQVKPSAQFLGAPELPAA